MSMNTFEKLFFTVLFVFSMSCIALLYVVAKHESDAIKNCKEAGGVPLSGAHYSPICMNPSALIELKDENP